MNPILNMFFSIIIMLLLIMASRKLLDNEHELLFFLILNIAGFIFEYLICGFKRTLSCISTYTMVIFFFGANLYESK